GDEDWPGRAEENRGTVFGEINVVVVLHAHRRAEAELYRTHLQIIRDLVDRLTARLGRGFTGERGADRILRAQNSSRKKQRNKKREAESAGERRRRSVVTHVGVGPVD